MDYTKTFQEWLKMEVAAGYDRKLAATRAAILATQPGATQCYPAGSCYGANIDSQHWPFSQSPARVAELAAAELAR